MLTVLRVHRLNLVLFNGPVRLADTHKESQTHGGSRNTYHNCRQDKHVGQRIGVDAYAWREDRDMAVVHLTQWLTSPAGQHEKDVQHYGEYGHAYRDLDNQHTQVLALNGLAKKNE